MFEQELTNSKSLHLDSSRIVSRYFIEEREDLVNFEYPKIPIPDKVGNEMMKILELRSGEVDLKYFHLVRLSRFVSLNKYETVRLYPLFSYDAKLEYYDESFYISLGESERSVIRNNQPNAILNDSEFKKLCTKNESDFHFVTQYGNLASKVEKSNTEELLFYPELWSVKRIRKELKKEFEEGDLYLPVSVLAVVERENNSFTTKDELLQLETANSFSAPLNSLFQYSENKINDKPGILCEELNESQLEAVKNVNGKNLSIISGPPGTGKSFTIANIAAEAVSKGQSVLITSKNGEALDVIEEKIDIQLKIENLCVNPTRDYNLTSLKDHLQFILGRNYTFQWVTFKSIEDKFKKFQKMHDHYLEIEKDLIKSLALERDYFRKNLQKGKLKEVSKKLQNRVITRRNKIATPLWESLNEYYNKIESNKEFVVDLLKTVNNFMVESSIRDNRSELRDYQSFLKRRDKKQKEELQNLVNYSVVLKTFPVWLIKANEISRILPMKKEMFDLLIIDEASQCDISSVLPLIQRARKCVIVGDSNQLNHISFISKAFEAANRRDIKDSKKHLCRYRDYSILDLAEDSVDPQCISYLNEHFRSQFPIISFSNEQFYKGKLNILSKRPVSSSKHVELVRLKGKRKSGVNETEVNFIVERIKKIVEKEKDLPTQYRSSIGILSPFRKQVDKIFNTIRNEFTLAEIKRHKMLVGTAFSFQGNEKDVMIISFCLDNSSVGGSFTFLNRNDVFNVSVTRARNHQFIYYSFDESNLNPDSTIAAFFRFYQLKKGDTEGKKIKDDFCDEIENELKKNNLETWRAFEISGVSIDLLIRENDNYYGLDLIGFPGEMEDYYSLERYKMLERGGINLFPVSYIYWQTEKEQCLQEIKRLILKM